MNPEYIAAGIIHTIPDKLIEYFFGPLKNIFVIITIIIMFANIYVLKKLWKIKIKDYLTLINTITLGIYSCVSIISAVLVSKLGLHGTIAEDNCDYAYMIIPRIIFIIVAIINIICFIFSIITKTNKDKEYKEVTERGYYSDDTTSSFKDRINSERIKGNINNISKSVKEKANEFIDSVKDIINKD